MSGTSLDGLDIACCQFTLTAKGWKYSITKATCLRYSPDWIKLLSSAHLLSGEQIVFLDHEYGAYLGKACRNFIQENNLRGVSFIASHGHTIFHQPEKGFTFQLGNGNAIHAASGLPVVNDFRSLDVRLGGQGAPLVPAGDKLLFREFDVCLNLGGIANLSVDVRQQRKAYDICFVNMGLNYLSGKLGKPFDRNGDLASEGEVKPALLKSLTKIYSSFRNDRPSLGREIFELRVRPLLDDEGIDIRDRLNTFVESSSLEIANAIAAYKRKVSVLCTGGGAYNAYLMSRLLHYSGDDVSLIKPEDEVIKFKEAVVFAFLGVLKVRGEVNCLSSVTGASRNNSGGVMTGFKN
jgi:anhydro-N-acetylmuramic acid kinase